MVARLLEGDSDFFTPLTVCDQNLKGSIFVTKKPYLTKIYEVV